MNADEFNSRYPIGTPVVAYPGCRPEGCPNDERLVTRTRSKAEVLGGHTDVVWVDGHDACINLTHVDVVTDAEPITDLATAVAVMGALPMPAGPASATPRWQQARTELIAKLYAYMPVTGAKDATDLLDEVIAEALLEGERKRPSRPAAEIGRLRSELKESAMEFAVCYPDGVTVMAETVTGDRSLAEARLRAHRETSNLWADCRLVQRTGRDGAWAEAGR